MIYTVTLRNEKDEYLSKRSFVKFEDAEKFMKYYEKTHIKATAECEY